MPWKETCAMDQRRKFIKDWLREEWNLSELCRAYEISRPTAYKWLKRFETNGLEGMIEASRAPKQHPNATPSEQVEAILAMKGRYASFGPKKIGRRLKDLTPNVSWPVASTIGEILKRHGLVVPRAKRRRMAPYGAPLCGDLCPNDVWAGDFKGWFRTGDGTRIDPLTISDVASRYLIRCRSVGKTDGAAVKAQFTMAFKEFGLPRAIRTDNGPPFASLGLGGLSALSIWLIKLGIKPERIRPAHPEENGVHERMHLTLKQETAQPPKANRRVQQESFDRFIEMFNYERPHEALGMKRPGEVYIPSARRFPDRLPSVEYPTEAKVRLVTTNGCLNWKDRRFFVANALAGERVGLVQLDNALWELRFGAIPIGRLDEQRGAITRL